MDNCNILPNEILHKALKNCLDPSITDRNFKLIFTKLLRQCWTTLAKNECIETNSWLLHSRVSVLGLHFISTSNNHFFNTMHYLCCFDNSNNKLYINDLELSISVDTPATFRVSVFYGLIHTLLVHKNLYKKDYKFLYKYIITQCQQQTRYNHIYFQLLSLFVHNFYDDLTKDDFDEIFDILYYNLDKKDCISLLNMFFETNKIEPSSILNTVLNHMSWKYKHKYILLKVILNKCPSLFTSLLHEECAKGLIYAQSKPYLSSSATKLYETILKHIDESIWLQIYYPALEDVIIDPGIPTLCHRKVLKNYLSFNIYHRSYFENIFENIFNLETAPIFTILKLTIQGVNHSLFKEDYNFDKIIGLGVNHTDNLIRNLSFHIFCCVKDVHSQESYEYIKTFILLNINEASQDNRHCIKNSYERFMIKLKNTIIRLQEISEELPVVKYSSNFLNWLIPFLLKQFNHASNYQRISLSLTLLSVTLQLFSRHAGITNHSFLEKHKQYLKIVPVLHNLSSYLPQFINVLEICHIEDTEKVISMLFELDFDKVPAIQIYEIQELGLKYICNSNMEVAENGQKLLEFINQLQCNDREWRFHRYKEMMFEQWNNIKSKKSENVVEDNPLHSLISLMLKTIHLHNSDEYEIIFSFIEDIVSSLLNVFGILSMLPFTSNNCIGIAHAFKNESSKYHKCSINCMWLVLKASCELAAKIVSILKTNNFMDRALNLLYSVIQKCYHKGALEEAGETLALIVSTATHQNYGITVIETFLQKVFDAVPQTTEATSTVRRAAETRIVLSSIALSDKRLHKPFFHKTMNFLIETVNWCLNQNKPETVAPVHSLALHCLHPIIMKNSVEAHIGEYLCIIFIISLNSFECGVWKVRNAALQTFGAMTNKLLGTTLSSDEECCQLHAVCLEEVFLKYPSIYDYIFKRLCEANLNPHKSMNTIIPILSFLSMSYARDDILIDSTKVHVNKLLDQLLNYINVAPNLQIFILAAKAFCTLSNNDRIIIEIDRIKYRISTEMCNNIFFSLIYLLKVLSDKIIDDTIPTRNFDNVESIVFSKLDAIYDILANRNTFQKAISGLLLDKPGFKYILPEHMKENLSYLSVNLYLTNKLPGILECIEIKLKHIFTFSEATDTIPLIKSCLMENNTIHLKFCCLKALETSMSQNISVKNIYEKELTNTLIYLLLDKKYMWIKYLMRECIYLLLNLRISHIPDDLNNKMLENYINDIKNNLIPVYYIPVFCCICESMDSSELYVKEFVGWSIDQCLKNLENENLDILILISLKFSCKYVIRNRHSSLIIKSLKCVYKMLQRDEPELRQECAIISSFCLNIKPKHTYGIMLEFLTKDTLLKLIDPYSVLQFLVQVFSERQEKSYSINVFDKKNTLAIETEVLETYIYQEICDIFKMNLENQQEFIFWFKKYRKSLPDNIYVNVLTKIFEKKVSFNI